MISLSWIDFYYLTKEFKSQLLGARIDSFYGNHEELHIKLYKAGQKNIFLSSYISKGITLISNSKNQHNPKNGFVQYLRKYLTNGFIDDVISYEKERIITLKISKKNKEDNHATTYFIHLEHFMGGQAYLSSNKNKILKSIKSIQDTEIKESLTYSIKSSEFSLLENFSLDTNNTLQDAIKQLGIGKIYLNYLLKANEIDMKISLNSLDKNIISNIESNLHNLLQHDLKPSMYDELLLPFTIKNSKNLNVTYSKALFDKYSKELITNTTLKEPAKLTKLKKRLQEQEKNLKKIEKENDSLQEKGSLIYEEYQLLNEFLEKIKNEVSKEGYKSLKDKIKSNEQLTKIITQINEKDHKININLEELKKVSQFS